MVVRSLLPEACDIGFYVESEDSMVAKGSLGVTDLMGSENPLGPDDPWDRVPHRSDVATGIWYFHLMWWLPNEMCELIYVRKLACSSYLANSATIIRVWSSMRRWYRTGGGWLFPIWNVVWKCISMYSTEAGGTSPPTGLANQWNRGTIKKVSFFWRFQD